MPASHRCTQVNSSGGFVMPNSMGFAYEAAAFARAVGRGALECDEWRWGESLVCLGIIDEWREQVRRSASQ